MASTRAKREANARYLAGQVSMTLRFDPERDADLIAWLGRQPNKAKAVREAIRKCYEDETP